MGPARSLFQEVSEAISYILDTRILDYSKGELVFLRKTVLDELSKGDITNETYNPRKHFWKVMGLGHEKVNDLSELLRFSTTRTCVKK